MLVRLFLILIVCSQTICAQIMDASQIKTVMVVQNGKNQSQMIQSINNTFVFSFDDLSEYQNDYFYLITHCNIDWTPSNLPTSDYIDGFDNMQINNLESSFGTLQNYTHHQFSIPNEDTKITRSGNYLFQILDEDDELVCERKIILYDNKIDISLKISETRDLSSFNEKQALALTLYNNSGLKINYPDTEIKPFIFQNGDLKNRTPFLKPTFTEPNTYIYRPTKETEFIAGNEFYYFDNNEVLKSTRFISTAYREDNSFNTLLYTQKSRANRTYTYNPDINGGFVIRNFTASNSNIEAEYSNVLFSLLNEEDFKEKDIYVYGAFNNYKLTEENLLKPDASNKYLMCSVLIKQGFYNYDFVTKENNRVNRKTISGSFFETENKYEALIYFHPMNSIYYEVIGYGTANSTQQTEN